MKHFIAFIISIIAIVPSTHAQETFEFGQKSYYYENNSLWAKEPNSNHSFQVNTEVITVKATEQFDATQITNFLQDNDLRMIRTAVTGYTDIQVLNQNLYQETLFKLQNSGLFSVVEPTTIGQYLIIPNDNQYPSQWHLPQVSAEAAWDITTGSSSVVVAVLDSGTEFTHDDLGTGSDLYNNIWINAGEDSWADPENPNTGNGIDDDNNGFVDDWKGWDFDNQDNDGSGSFFHGTAVAGVTAAKTNNTLGVAGIAGGNNSKGVSIMIGNVGNNAPNGSVLDDAILYAADNGARIVQLSLSVGTSQAIDDAIDLAYSQGVLIINAAGNGGSASVSYPASHQNVMAIGASNINDQKTNFSQYGTDLEVSAPGQDIVTTTTNNSYTTTSGTSFSAPLTSGIASLVMSINPNLSNEQVRQILKDSADKVGGYNYDNDPSKPGHSLEMGYGRVNALNALLLANTINTIPLIFNNGFESIPDVIFANGFE